MSTIIKSAVHPHSPHLVAKAAGEVAKARRSVRRAALAVELAVVNDRTAVQDRIEDLVRAGTALEQAEAERRAVAQFQGTVPA